MRHRRGFTLFEIIVAIILVGIVLGTTTVSYESVRQRLKQNGDVMVLAAMDAEARRIAAGSGMVLQPTLPTQWKLPTGYSSVAGDLASTGPKQLSVRVAGNVLTIAVLSGDGKVCNVVYDNLNIDVSNPEVRRPIFGRDRAMTDPARCTADIAGPRALTGIGAGTPEKPRIADFD